jgi:hypothetical protein
MLRPMTEQEKWQQFKKDWAEFQKSREYRSIKECIEQAGIKEPFSENIIYRVFWSGYYRKPFISNQGYYESDEFLRKYRSKERRN